MDFSINGRYLAQKATGVQRYASEVTKAIDSLLGGDFRHLTGSIVIPAGALAPEFANLRVKTVEKRASFLWEQYDLPRAADGVLICFGNTGPLLYRNKIVCIHGANFKLSPGSYSALFECYIRTMIPLVAKTSRKIASVSKFSTELIATTYGIPVEKIILAVNGFEHARRWESAKSDVATRFAISDRFVLLVGSLSKHKNWGMIAHIAADLQRTGLQIVAIGAGGNEFKDRPGSIPDLSSCLGACRTTTSHGFIKTHV